MTAFQAIKQVVYGHASISDFTHLRCLWHVVRHAAQEDIGSTRASCIRSHAGRLRNRSHSPSGGTTHHSLICRENVVIWLWLQLIAEVLLLLVPLPDFRAWPKGLQSARHVFGDCTNTKGSKCMLSSISMSNRLAATATASSYDAPTSSVSCKHRFHVA